MTTSGQIYDNYINKNSGSSFFYPDPNAGTVNYIFRRRQPSHRRPHRCAGHPSDRQRHSQWKCCYTKRHADAKVTINVYDGKTLLGTTTANSSGAWTYTTGSLSAGTHAFTATATDVPLQSGLGGNTSAASAPVDPTIGSTTTTPSITSIAESPASGDLNAGKSVTFTLNLNEAVTVAGGTPTLTLNDGGTATYTGGSGTNALTFSYTVGAGQNTAALAATAVNLNSATVTDGAGNAANLSLSGLTQSGPQIDTITPTISSLAESPASGDLNAGKTVTLTLDMSEVVTVNTTAARRR